MLALRLLLSPALVGAAFLAGRRWGPRAGGLLAALPIVAGPALLVFALEQGAAFAAGAAWSALLGLAPLTCFCLAHAAVARAAVRLRRGAAVPLALSTGWLAFLATAALLRPLRPPAWACPLAGAAALALGLALLPAPREDGRPAARHHPLLELALRMAAAAALVAALTGAAARLGPAWSGLLAPFPVAGSVVVAGAHLAEGPGRLGETLRGFLSGLFGFVAFLAVLAPALPRLGTGTAFGLALPAGLAVSAIAARRPWARLG